MCMFREIFVPYTVDTGVRVAYEYGTFRKPMRYRPRQGGPHVEDIHRGSTAGRRPGPADDCREDPRAVFWTISRAPRRIRVGDRRPERCRRDASQAPGSTRYHETRRSGEGVG